MVAALNIIGFEPGVLTAWAQYAIAILATVLIVGAATIRRI